MASIENYVHPRSCGLPPQFVESLVRDEMLPRDVAFRSLWLPHERIDRNKVVLRSEIIKQDILAATGRVEPTVYFDTYLSPSAEPPPCVTIEYPYKVRETVRTSSSTWHTYEDLRELVADSGAQHVDRRVTKIWHKLILEVLRGFDSDLQWPYRLNSADVHKRTHAGEWIRAQIARTVIEDTVLGEYASTLGENEEMMDDVAIRVKDKSFNGLHVLLANSHPDEYLETRREWEEATENNAYNLMKPMSASQALQYFTRRANRRKLTSRELGWVSGKFAQEDLSEEFSLLISKGI